MKLISERTEELKEEMRIKEKVKKRRLASAGCMAACIMIVAGMGALMPSLVNKASANNITYKYGSASMLAQSPALGYILLGMMSFALGVCVTLVILRFHRKDSREDPDKNKKL